MSILSRILNSIQDGSFAIKVLNHISRTRYVPSQEAIVEDWLAEHYPDDSWKGLSTAARQVWVDLSPLFTEVDIETIVYVGAHDGQVAAAMDCAFPGRDFYLIEPVPIIFQTLMASTSDRPNMKCLNLAAGASEEFLEMHVDRFPPASSFLSYEEKALQEFPFLGQQQTVKVHIKPLDHILRDVGCETRDLLVIDVQGYEDKVLQGARETLHSCKAIISELSLQSLYVGSSTFDSVYQALSREGFSLRYLVNPLKGASQTVLQIDGVFVRG